METPRPYQLEFLAPQDARLVHCLRRLTAEAARICEPSTRLDPADVIIDSPAVAAELLTPEIGALPQEQLHVLTLNTKNRLLAARMLYQGTLASSHVRIAEVLRPAIIDSAAAVLVAHNHPSGDPTPSPQDVALTRQMVEAGRLLDIDVLDHLVICADRWVSLRERGCGF